MKTVVIRVYGPTKLLRFLLSSNLIKVSGLYFGRISIDTLKIIEENLIKSNRDYEVWVEDKKGVSGFSLKASKGKTINDIIIY